MKKNKLQYIPFYLLILGFIAYGIYNNLTVNEIYKKGVSYTIGEIYGFSNGAKGSRYIDFKYHVMNKEFIKSKDLGLNSSSLKVGDKVFVEYSIIDPSLSLLLETLPDNVKLGDTLYNK